jgi:hypothetical protein
MEVKKEHLPTCPYHPDQMWAGAIGGGPGPDELGEVCICDDFDHDLPPDPNALDVRYYGGSGTIHQTGHVDVETSNGKVVAVWFRCCMLPFRQTEVEALRKHEMEDAYLRGDIPKLHGVEVE